VKVHLQIIQTKQFLYIFVKVQAS